MSLTKAQQDNTRKELQENFDKSGVSLEQAAADLATTPEYIEQLLWLRPVRHDHTWILRNYLLKKVRENGKTPTEFTALKGSARDYWFLDGDYVDRGKIQYP